MQEIFTEKYRPKEFSEVIGIDPEIQKQVEYGNIPHLLFEGPAGTGKTTVAKIIIDKLNADVLILNASKDRGINVIRDRIEPFAKKISDKIKIVFLDEFDATTPQFQTALRNMMETHASSTRFIATCNYKNKVIAPLISRFAVINFSKHNPEDVFNHLKTISEKEGIKVEDDVLNFIVKKYKSDIRGMINFLNKNKEKDIKKEDVSYENQAISVLASLKNKKWFDLRQKLLTEDIDYEALMEELDKYIFNNNSVPETVKMQSNILVSKYMFEMNFSFNKEVCFSAFMAELQGVLQW